MTLQPQLRTKLLSAAIVAAIGGFIIFTSREAPTVPPQPAPAESAVETETQQGRVLGEEAPVADASPAGTLEAGEGETRYRIAEGSKASFSVNEVLRGEPFTVVGVTDGVEGDIVLDAAGGKARIGTMAIDARLLATDSSMRDGMIRRAILNTEAPENAWIVFTPTSVDGLPSTLAEGAPFDLSITGDLTILGTTKQVTFLAAAQLSGDKIIGKADAVIMYPDFGISIPKVPFVAAVDDEVKLTIDIVAIKAR